MYAIIDKRCSEEIKINLASYVDAIFEFSSEDVTYNSISGHPDIFMFQDGEKLIVAPNAPKDLFQFFTDKKIKYTLGKNNVGKSLKESTPYNCFCSKDYFFHKQNIPDISIQNYAAKKQPIRLPQAYVRCSMFGINNTKMVTSDLGVVKALIKNNIEYFYFEPSEIIIKDHKYGFIGGTMGSLNNTIFFLGDILKHKDGKALQDYITLNNQKVICLGKDFLYDGGGIFFIA